MRQIKSGLSSQWKELLNILKNFQIDCLVRYETNNIFIQFFRYSLVGAAASFIDWGALYLLVKLGLHYLMSASISFLAGLLSNFCMSRAFVFKGSKSKRLLYELWGYVVIGFIGLLITLALMFFMTDILGVYFMLSKMFVTLIVLFWNFIARKIIVYS